MFREEEFIGRVVSKFRVTIPPTIREVLDLRRHDHVRVRISKVGCASDNRGAGMLDAVINMGIGIFLGVVVMAAMTEVALMLVQGLGGVGTEFVSKLGEKMNAVIDNMWGSVEGGV